MTALPYGNGSYRAFFEYQEKQRIFTIGRVSAADQVEYLLMRLGRGLFGLLADVRHRQVGPARWQGYSRQG